MKLVQCHVENFGHLQNYDYHFTDGLNCIKQDNGWGKSTLATFIKAMFYGLPTTTRRNLNENERKKYQPWQGGNFGGNLIFEVGGKQYKIERSFGKKAADDTFNLINVSTGKSTRDFSANLGVELFQLDADAFERSCYLPQKVLDSAINESISARLNHLLQGGNEDFNFENAKNRLDKKRVALSNQQKTGQVENLQAQIDTVEIKIHELENRGQIIPQYENEIAENNIKVAELLDAQNRVKAQIKDYGKLEQKRANQDLYAQYNHAITDLQTQIATAEQVLNHHQTNQAEIDHYVGVEQNIAAKTSAMQMQADAGYLRAREQELTQYFGGKIPTTEQIQATTQAVMEYQTIQNRTGRMAPADVVTQRKRKVLCCSLLGVGLFLVLAGAILLTMQTAVAITLIVVGGVGTLGAAYLSLVNLINTKTANAGNVDSQQLQADQARLVRLQKQILEFLTPYENTDDYQIALNRVQDNLRAYQSLTQQKAWVATQSDTLAHELANEQTQLDQYLAQFKFANSVQLPAEKLRILAQTLADLTAWQKQLTIKNQALAQFKADKNFDMDETAVITDINALQQADADLQKQIDTHKTHIATLSSQINAINYEMADLDDLRQHKADLQAQLVFARAEHKAVQNAIQYLQTAKQSLSAKFLEPLKQGLQKYLTKLTEQDFHNLNLDTDFKLQLEEYGQLHDVNSYSLGYQNAFNLSMRFALIDTLYMGEKPFIILDDPFINLDETKIAKAKAFLNDIAHDRQLIYFSCHSSRC